MTHCLAKRFLHIIEVCSQTINTESRTKIRLVAPGEELGQVAEVAQPVVDGRRGQHEERLRPRRIIQEVIEPIVARRLDSFINTAWSAWITEMMGFVNYYDVGERCDPAKPLGKITLAAKVRMAEYRETAKVGVSADATNVRKPLAQVRLPYRLFRRLRSKQHHPLAFMQHQTLDQHQSYKGLAESDAVAKKGATVLAGDLQKRPIALLLIAVEPGVHLRPGFVPLRVCQLMTAEIFLESFRVDVKWGVEVGMARDGFDDNIGYFARQVPMRLEPLLELRHFARALNLNIELDVIGQTGSGKVT